jgi:hypothetical protein
MTDTRQQLCMCANILSMTGEPSLAGSFQWHGGSDGHSCVRRAHREIDCQRQCFGAPLCRWRVRSCHGKSAPVALACCDTLFHGHSSRRPTMMHSWQSQPRLASNTVISTSILTYYEHVLSRQTAAAPDRSRFSVSLHVSYRCNVS